MIVTNDYTHLPPEMPMDGWVESCPRCGRSGIRQASEDGGAVIVHVEETELMSDGMFSQPADCCFL